MGLALLRHSRLVRVLGTFGIGAIANPVWDDMKPAHEPLIVTQGEKNCHVDGLVACHRFLSSAYGTVPKRRLATGSLRSAIPIMPGCQLEPLPLPCRLKGASVPIGPNVYPVPLLLPSLCHEQLYPKSLVRSRQRKLPIYVVPGRLSHVAI
jgi:hypothetical protein